MSSPLKKRKRLTIRRVLDVASETVLRQGAKSRGVRPAVRRQSREAQPSAGPQPAQDEERPAPQAGRPTPRSDVAARRGGGRQPPPPGPAARETPRQKPPPPPAPPPRSPP